MVDVSLSQAEAEALIAMEKFRTDSRQWPFPFPGQRLSIPLLSADKRETFDLDVTRGRIKLTKATFQNRARQAIVLMRLDLDGPPHMNPDGVELPCPHLHKYREGYGMKWAVPLPADYPDPADLVGVCRHFMDACRIVNQPDFIVGLF